MINATFLSPRLAPDACRFLARRLQSSLQHGFRFAPVAAFLLAIMLLLLPHGAQATVYTVSVLGDSGTNSLRWAVAQAGDGDTINFAASLKGSTIKLSGTAEIAITHSITITGPGASSLSIDGHATSRIFNITGANVTISGLTLFDGCDMTDDGGAIYCTRNLTLNNCVLEYNQTAFDGGAISNHGGSLTLTGCTVNNNECEYEGGGIDSRGLGSSLYMINCTVSDNQTDTASMGITAGGGILTDSYTTLIGCTISGNESLNYFGIGGGIANYGAPTFYLSNCTIANNLAYHQGGGIINYSGVAMYVTACTISNNAAMYGGGIWGGGTLDSSIVAKNPVPTAYFTVASSPATPDMDNGGTYASASFTSYGYNIIGSVDGWSWTSGAQTNDLVETDPMLSALGQNGGPTQTMALKPGSPAINNGDDSLVAYIPYDQRGFPRLTGPHSDTGAYEAQGTLAGPTVVTKAATGVSGTGGTLNATVIANGASTKVQFYVDLVAPVPGNLGTPVGSAVTVASGSHPVSVTASNIHGHTTYYFTAKATNSNATEIGATQTFTTKDNQPVAHNGSGFLEWSGTTGTAVVNVNGYVSDIDGDPLTIAFAASPTGTATLTGTSGLQVTYTTSGTTGGDYFTYTISDSQGGFATGTFTLVSGNLPCSTASPWIPVGYTLGGVGIPAINDNGNVACTVLLKYFTQTTSGILAGAFPAVVAWQGEPVPDVTGTASLMGVQFASFGDPVTDSLGNVAFQAKLTGPLVTAGKDDIGIWTNAPDGIMRLLKRTGSSFGSGFGAILSGTSTAPIASFQALSLQDVQMSGTFGPYTAAEVIYSATLKTGGAAAITSANDAGIWSLLVAPGGSLTEALLVREGVSKVSGAPSPFKGIEAFGSLPFVSGQARSYTSPGTVTFLTGWTGYQAILNVTTQSVEGGTEAGVLDLVALTGSSTGNPAWGTWSVLGVPVSNAVSSTNPVSITAFLGTSQTSSTNAKTGRVTPINHTGIFVGGTAFAPVALIGGTAPDLSGSAVRIFTAFRNPVLTSDSNRVAFVATVKGTGVTAANNSGIWWTGTSGTLALAAQTGVTASYLPAGAKFTGFDSIALPPGSAGPIFVATIAGTGIAAGNNTGAWSVNGSGKVTQLLRTGGIVQVSLGLKTIKGLSLLGVGTTPTTPGITRSFNSSGQVACRAVFTDNSQAVILINAQP